MAWSDFDLESALERDLLQRALPLVPTQADGASRATVDLASNTVQVAVGINETLGATPVSCVELLRIRPLLVGAAWKVIDLLLETALELAAFQPDGARGWSIRRKVAHANVADGRPAVLSVPVWTALARTYSETAELRHSLVHRRAYTDQANSLIGNDVAGVQLRPLTSIEQEALVRSALRSAQLVIAPVPDRRVEADLVRQLAALYGLHRLALPPVTVLDSLPEITVIIDAGGDGTYVLDIPALWRRQPFQGASHADLIVQFRERPGQQLCGRLEDAPSDVVQIDPDSPPDWLE